MFFDILNVGAVSAVGPLQVVLTVLIHTRLVAGFGTAALAGYGIGARLEFLLGPIVFAIGIAGVPMVGMAIGAGNVALGGWHGPRPAWAILVLGTIGLAVTVAPELWSGLFTGDPAVRAAVDVYLRRAGPGFAFVGLGLGLSFASQGSGKILSPVLAGTVRLALIALGGLVLTLADTPAWSLFALVGASMAAFGLGVAAAVYLTPWGRDQ